LEFGIWDFPELVLGIWGLPPFETMPILPNYMKSKIQLFSLLTIVCSSLSARAADTYKIDPVHSSVGFSIRHFSISNVRGKFDEFNGEVVLEGKDIKEARGTIQTKGIDTGNSRRDDDLRGPNFFDVAKYPTITFQSKRVENKGNQTMLIGDFTMHGVTKELSLPVTINGPIEQRGNKRIGLEAKTKISRKDYGMTGGAPAVGDEVELEINAEATQGGPR